MKTLSPVEIAYKTLLIKHQEHIFQYALDSSYMPEQIQKLLFILSLNYRHKSDRITVQYYEDQGYLVFEEIRVGGFFILQICCLEEDLPV